MNTSNEYNQDKQPAHQSRWQKKKQGKAKYKKWGKRILFGMLGLMIIGFLSLLLLYTTVYWGAFGKLPTKSELQAIKNPQATKIYGSDGVLLGKYFTENRNNVQYDEISPNVVGALVATEDARYFKHNGMDFRATLRVIFKNVILQDRGAGGGSTINQQLIKNLYKRENFGLLSIPVFKMKEIIVGRRIDKVFTKKDIIANYLNTVPFGERAFGIGTASQRYFNKMPQDLSLEEAATLIGMLKATGTYNPRRNPEMSKVRRNVVLNQMAKYKDVLKENIGLTITDGMIKATKQFPLELNYKRYTTSSGLAPHFREKVKGQLKKWCAENEKPDGSNYSLYNDGLKIYTTIDSRMQEYAQQAVSTHLSALQKDYDAHWKGREPWEDSPSFIKRAMQQTNRYKAGKKAGKSNKDLEDEFTKTYIKMDIMDPTNGAKVIEDKLMTPMDSLKHYLNVLNTGFFVMDHQTGDVKVWVGSIDHQYFPFDHTRATRQVGSTFKPIVYATALERGVAPCQFYDNDLRTYIDEYDKRWTPRNSDGKYEGQYSIKGAIANSVNTVSAQVLYDAGIDSIIMLAKDMGIYNDIPEVPSIALGTAELSLQEMVTAYCSFANGGKKVTPNFIAKIEDAAGNVLAEFNKKDDDNDDEYALSQETAIMMVEMLQGVVDSGTAQRLRFRYGLTQDFGGKTGTTQSHTDGWFVGITPNLAAGVWTGGANNYIRFRTINYGQGANMALPVFGEFFQKLYADYSFTELKNASFEEPPEEILAMLDCELWRAFEPMGIDTLLDSPVIAQGDGKGSTGRNAGKTTFPGTRTKPKNTVPRKQSKPRSEPEKEEGFFNKLFGKKKKKKRNN